MAMAAAAGASPARGKRWLVTVAGRCPDGVIRMNRSSQGGRLPGGMTVTVTTTVAVVAAGLGPHTQGMVEVVAGAGRQWVAGAGRQWVAGARTTEAEAGRAIPWMIYRPR